MIFSIKYCKEKNLSCGSGVWKHHLKLLRCSPQVRVERCESRDREGIVNMWFRHAHPRHCEHVISSRSFLTWGEHKQLPVMFSAYNNFSPCIFPLLYFFYEHLRRLRIIYSAQLHFLQNTKNKKTRNWKGKAVVLDTYSFATDLFIFSLYILFFFEHLCRFSIL
jgi:hypothetical protein